MVSERSSVELAQTKAQLRIVEAENAANLTRLSQREKEVESVTTRLEAQSSECKVLQQTLDGVRSTAAQAAAAHSVEVSEWKQKWEAESEKARALSGEKEQAMSEVKEWERKFAACEAELQAQKQALAAAADKVQCYLFVCRMCVAVCCLMHLCVRDQTAGK